jgi:hypothetical protein
LPYAETLLPMLGHFDNYNEVLDSAQQLSPGESPVVHKVDVYWKHVSQYSRRNLTYDSDALNAILGLLEVFQVRRPAIHHFWGLPLVISSSLWERTASLADCLAWVHRTRNNSQQCRRRTAFPSWSWTGWEGIVSRNPSFYGSTKVPLMVNFWLENRAGMLLSLEDLDLALLSGHLSPEPQLLSFLHIECWILKPHVWDQARIMADSFFNVTTSIEALPMLNFELALSGPVHAVPSLLRRLRDAEACCLFLSHEKRVGEYASVNVTFSSWSSRRK